MGEDLAEGVAWPEHPRPQARAALSDVRAAGWRFRKTGRSGHAFGTIRCPLADDARCCKVLVYSTSKSDDGSATAKVIRRKLRGCPHAVAPIEPSDELDQLDDAEVARRAGRLIDAIGSLHARAAAIAARGAALDDDDETAFDVADRAIDEHDATGISAWGQLNRPISAWPPEIAIADLTTEAEQFIGAVRAEPERTRLLARLGDVQR